MIEAPHPTGIAAFAWTCGATRNSATPLLVTLSAASSSSSSSPGISQEIAIWDCASIWSTLHGNNNDDNISSATDDHHHHHHHPILLASASLPLGSAPASSLTCASGTSVLLGKQGALGSALSQAALTQLAAGVPCSTLSTARVVDAFELLACSNESTTHSGSGSGSRITFFSVTCVAIPQRRAAGAGAAIETVEHNAWHIAASPGALPRGTPHARASATAAAFFDGARAAKLTENDAIAASISVVKLPGGPVGKTAVGGVPGEGATLLARATAAGVIAVAGCSDGALLEWVNVAAPLPSGTTTLPAKSTLSDVSLSLTRKVALKAVSLKRPEVLNLAKKAPAGYGAGGSGIPPPVVSTAITVITPTPSGRSLLIGTADGAVRLYDLHARLVAAWEGIDAGGISRIALAPSNAVRTPPPPPPPVTLLHVQLLLTALIF
jgi:hypothetical protein